ncbi:MAG: hypothetical protein EOO01_00890 [Chitinophagaceae bacterium]|nr:MAG: hypothetical protein EOO01_00890 [Chitinophagaceae bacterium]
MLASLKKQIADKYFWMEFLLLVSITYLIAILSDVEYSYYEEGNGWKFINALEYRLSFGTFSFILFATYYWVFVKRFVDKRQPLLLFLSLLIFIPVMHYYNNDFVYKAINKLPFLSKELQQMAIQQYNSKRSFKLIYAYTLSSRCLPMIGFAYLIRALKVETQLKNLKEQQLISELNYLKAQLQPHFFFNTLNNIYALAIKQSPDTAPMIVQLSEMMRYILYQSSEKNVPLQQEVAFLHNYVELERIRHHQHITITFEVQGIDNDTRIEPLLLLPFIENAFKHGTHEAIQRGNVTIVLSLVAQELSLQVNNSKPSGEQRPDARGIGLQNANKRLELLYHGRYELETTEDEHHYEVNLNLKLA